MWIQFCLKFPLFAESELLRSLIAVKYNAENTFEIAKERAIVQDGMQTVQGLAGLKKANGDSFFSIKFLVTKYLGLTEADLKTNEDMKFAEAKENLLAAVAQAKEQGSAGPSGASPMGGGAPMGGMGESPMGGMGESPMGGGDMMGDTGGGMDAGVDMGGTSDMGGGDMMGDTGGGMDTGEGLA